MLKFDRWLHEFDWRMQLSYAYDGAAQFWASVTSFSRPLAQLKFSLCALIDALPSSAKLQFACLVATTHERLGCALAEDQPSGACCSWWFFPSQFYFSILVDLAIDFVQGSESHTAPERGIR